MTKLKLRRAWFQVHKWIGLILAVLIIPLSLSGSLLVWDLPIDHLVNPSRYAVSGADLLPPSRYAAAARQALGPGQRITSLTYPEGKGPIVIQASKPGEGARRGSPARTTIWLDPPSARILGVGDSGSGVVRFIHRLHGSLMVPGVGRTIVGWIGVAMMVSCFTGIWLWWPTAGRWVRGLRWRRHRNVDTNLHHLTGFWIALPLFVLSLTGAWIALPGLFGGGRQGGGPPRRFGSDPVAMTMRSADDVVSAVHARQPGEITGISWPTTGRAPDWSVTVTSPAGREQTVSVGDRDGRVALKKPRARGGGGISSVMRRIHDGRGMGPVWQTIIFIGGIIPALLAITGIIMWWRARGWRAELAARQRSKATVG